MQLQFSVPIIFIILAYVTNSLVIPRQSTSATPYDCGCSPRKQQLESYGATSQDMGIAFQETGSALSGTAYAWGDGKSGDSANFGLFKNNWLMIRTACSQFAGLQESDYAQGAVLNTNDAAAVTCLHEQMDHFGGIWFAVQRDGATGMENPDTADIQRYQDGVQAIQGYLEQDHMTDDMTAWVEIPSI